MFDVRRSLSALPPTPSPPPPLKKPTPSPSPGPVMYTGDDVNTWTCFGRVESVTDRVRTSRDFQLLHVEVGGGGGFGRAVVQVIKK